MESSTSRKDNKKRPNFNDAKIDAYQLKFTIFRSINRVTGNGWGGRDKIDYQLVLMVTPAVYV